MYLPFFFFHFTIDYVIHEYMYRSPFMHSTSLRLYCRKLIKPRKWISVRNELTNIFHQIQTLPGFYSLCDMPGAMKRKTYLKFWSIVEQVYQRRSFRQRSRVAELMNVSPLLERGATWSMWCFLWASYKYYSVQRSWLYVWVCGWKSRFKSHYL